MIRNSSRLLALVRQGMGQANWLGCQSELLRKLGESTEVFCQEAPVRYFHASRNHQLNDCQIPWSAPQAGGSRNMSSVDGEDEGQKPSRVKRNFAEFEDVMHKRRVFSKIVMRVSTRHKTKIRGLDFKEGIEAQEAQRSNGEQFFVDLVDIVGRFRDDMDHINAATVLHRMGCIAICFPDKSWILEKGRSLLVDFVNFITQPETLDTLELRQAVMSFWGVSSMGPGVLELSLGPSSDERIRDRMRKLEAHMRTCDPSVRNGNNICNVLEASAMMALPLEEATLEYLLTGAPSLLADANTGPQNLAGMLWAMSRMGIKDQWGTVPVALDVLSKKHLKVRLDEIAEVVKALADMGVTDYGQFMDETVRRIQVTTDYTTIQMSADHIVAFAQGLAGLKYENHKPIMDYLSANIKKRDIPLSHDQMEEFKTAAEGLGYELGSLEKEAIADAA